MVRIVLALLIGISLCSACQAQNDTIPAPAKTNQRHKFNIYRVDSLTRAVHNPHKATLYSTFFPGLGQIYNRKYWKVPIVWAAVGIPVYTYFYNKHWYEKCQFAISLYDTYAALGLPIPPDSLALVDPKLQGFMNPEQEPSLRTYRNEFRKDQDYSVLFFLLFWGLNIVDATVDAHLMSFDISNQLTFRLQPPSAPVTLPGLTGMGMGLSLMVDFHKPRKNYRTFAP
jgi:hypothetical protein